MVVDAKGFTFAGKTSDEFGLIMCSFEGSEPSDTSGGKIEFTKIDSSIQNRWYKTGNANYSEPLQFSFQIVKSTFEPFDAYDYSSIARWLVRKDGYKDFMITRSDYDNIHFNVQMNIEPIEVAGNIVGITVNGITDSPFGYNQLITKTIDINGSDTFSFVDMSDEIGYIYPDIEIEINNACDLKIVNQSENNRTFILRNCIPNEIITIDGKYLQISTTALSHKIYEDCNYIFPRIVNDYNKRKNVFTIEGNCSLKMQYRPIRKVGV